VISIHANRLTATRDTREAIAIDTVATLGNTVLGLTSFGDTRTRGRGKTIAILQVGQAGVVALTSVRATIHESEIIESLRRRIGGHILHTREVGCTRVIVSVDNGRVEVKGRAIVSARVDVAVSKSSLTTIPSLTRIDSIIGV